MSFPKKQSSNSLQCIWKYKKHDDCDAIEKIKDSSQDLKSFILEAQTEKADLQLAYIVDGIDFASWLNSLSRVEGLIGEVLCETNCFLFNQTPYNKINFLLQRIHLNKLLGHSTSHEKMLEAVFFYQKMKEPESQTPSQETMDTAADWHEEDKQDTMLYCPRCCADRQCGYFPIHITDNEQFIYWSVRIPSSSKSLKLELKFHKENYFKEFEPYSKLLDLEVMNLKKS